MIHAAPANASQAKGGNRSSKNHPTLADENNANGHSSIDSERNLFSLALNSRLDSPVGPGARTYPASVSS
jgi:hypothetical protein